MPRSSRALPTIPVKHTLIRKVLNLTPPLQTKLHAYIAYYTQLQGLAPTQAPTDADTIVALLGDFLDRDAGFNEHLRGTTTPLRQSRGALTGSRKHVVPSSDDPAT